MATITYLIAPCAGGSAVTVEFSASTLPVVGGNYYLYFTGETEQGCYEVVDTAEPGTGTDEVTGALGTNYGDCVTCLENNPTPSPTPTNTVTPTPTTSPTRTPTQTPTRTVTPTVTSSITPTPTVTSSVTPTVTRTSTPTPTPSVTTTITPSVTPTRTVTPTLTSSVTPTPSVTSSVTPTPSVTPTRTVTPTVSPTSTVTPTVTSTSTPTPTPTITPTPSNFGIFEVDVQYTYNDCYTCSGDTITRDAPHPVDWVPVGPNGQRQGTVIDMSAVALGGFNGLNN